MTKQKEKKLKVKLEEKTKKDTQLSEEELEGVTGGTGALSGSPSQVADPFELGDGGGKSIDSIGTEFAKVVDPNTVRIKR